MNTHLNQSPCGAISLTPEGSLPISGAALEALARRGRCLQSAAIRDAATAIAGAIRSGLHSMAQGFRRQQSRRGAISQLSRLNNHVLTDIGIARDQIPSVVEGMLARQSAAATVARRAARIRQTRIDAAASIPSLGDCGPAVNDDDCRPLAA